MWTTVAPGQPCSESHKSFSTSLKNLRKRHPETNIRYSICLLFSIPEEKMNHVAPSSQQEGRNNFEDPAAQTNHGSDIRQPQQSEPPARATFTAMVFKRGGNYFLTEFFSGYLSAHTKIADKYACSLRQNMMLTPCELTKHNPYHLVIFKHRFGKRPRFSSMMFCILNGGFP